MKGGTYFFTVALNDRRADTLVSHIGALRHALHLTQLRRPFRIDAMVVLPEHLHAIWSLPEGDADYSGRWRMCKSLFVRQLAKLGVRATADGTSLWQARFWEHLIRDEADFTAHVNYIHYNPVKHGHVRRVRDWPWSSFHLYVRDGRLPVDWASSGETTGQFGE
nr:transposase [Dyella telluris]